VSQKVASAEGTVAGISTDVLSSEPQSLLPVETYYGLPNQLSVEAVLAAQNIVKNPEDIVAAFPPPAWGIGSEIKIYRATPVEIIDWGKPTLYRTWATTVEALLAEKKLELGENDKILPVVSTTLAIDPARALVPLVITRVAITEVKQKETIAFKRIEKEDPELPRGQKKTDAGSAGERTKVYRVTRENGVEVSRVLLSNEVTKEPKDETVIIGTKVIIGKSHSGRASWYDYASTKVATDLFKKGTQLRITNLDTGKVIFVTNDGCICADTGYVVDLNPVHFRALGGNTKDGVMKRVKVDEVLN
jgi:hypothetical protein